MIPFKLKDFGNMGVPHKSKVPSPLCSMKIETKYLLFAQSELFMF